MKMVHPRSGPLSSKATRYRLAGVIGHVHFLSKPPSYGQTESKEPPGAKGPKIPPIIQRDRKIIRVGRRHCLWPNESPTEQTSHEDAARLVRLLTCCRRRSRAAPVTSHSSSPPPCGPHSWPSASRHASCCARRGAPSPSCRG